MIGRILDFSVRARWAIIGVVALIAVLGVYNLVRLPIDAVPDITNKQVQINTVVPALAPALAPAPALALARSRSLAPG